MAKLLKLLAVCALLVGAAAIAMLAGSAAAADAIGSPGGEPFATRCEGGRYVVGLAGRAEQWLTQVAPICVRTNAYGQWMEPPRTGPAVGVPAGRSFFTVCPADSVATGYYGEASDFVRNIGLACRREGQSAPERHWSRPALMHGSLIPASSARRSCPPGQAANAVAGSASHFINRLGLACTVYDVEPPPSLTGARTGAAASDLY